MNQSDDKTLLLALAKYSEPFDAAKIHGWINFDDNLWRAISFLRVRPNKADERIGLRRLNETSLQRIRRWFTRVHRKNINGLMLVKHPDGWCDVKTVP